MKWASPVDEREAFAKVLRRQCWVLWPLAAMAFTIVIFEKQIEELGLLGQIFIAFVGVYAPLALTYGFLNYRCPRCKGLIYYKPTVCRRCEAVLR